MLCLNVQDRLYFRWNGGDESLSTVPNVDSHTG